ncbi:MAG: cytochrome c3 family protein [Acidobacteriota bacterium]
MTCPSTGSRRMGPRGLPGAGPDSWNRMRLAVLIATTALCSMPVRGLTAEHPDLEGEKLTKELCLSCHDTVAAEIAAGPHAATEEGCTVCHDLTKGRNPPYLAGTFVELCGACHDLNDKELATKHGSQPIAAASCTTCHAPHGSKNDALLLEYTHAPMAGGQCDSCHAPPENGKVKLVAENVQDICAACHEDLLKRFAGAKVVHPVIESEGCVSCHSPHASRYPAHLLEPETALCLNCHEDVAAELKMASSHAAARDPGCQACHDPHASNSAARLRGDVNAVCLACHQSPAAAGSLPAVSIEIMPGVSVPGSYLRKVHQINLDKNGTGHPIFGHPVSGPIHPSENGKALDCLSCHVPHGTASPKLLAFPIAPGEGVCQKCHKM